MKLFFFPLKNYNEILDELDMLQKVDRDRRQKDLMSIPVIAFKDTRSFFSLRKKKLTTFNSLKKEIFLPSWQRSQQKNELQLELEREFEKIYSDSSKFKLQSHRI